MAFGQYRVGQIITVEAENGMPLDQYWRRRIQDAKQNNCITVKVPGAAVEITDDKKTKRRGKVRPYEREVSSRKDALNKPSKSTNKDDSEVSK